MISRPGFVIDAYKEPEDVPKRLPASYRETRREFIERLRNTPTHLVRLRRFSIDRWSVAFFTYGNERYEPCCFPNGEWNNGTAASAAGIARNP